MSFGKTSIRRYLFLLFVGAPLSALVILLIESWLELPFILGYPPTGLVVLFLLCFVGMPWVMNMPQFPTLFRMYRTRRKFEPLFAQYNDETMICSTSNHMRKAKAYPKLIEMGEAIVPFLLNELRKEEWGISTQLLLHEITHVDPSAAGRESVADGHMMAIDVRRSADLWIQWGEEKGLLF